MGKESRKTYYETKFVDKMPIDSEMEEGILYVAPHLQVAIHKCMCGCGEKVVTPLEGNGWLWEYSNIMRTVSLTPSIGNFQFPCKSHYYLSRGNVLWV